MTLVVIAKDPFFPRLKIEDKQLPGIYEMVNFTPHFLSFPTAISSHPVFGDVRSTPPKDGPEVLAFCGSIVSEQDVWVHQKLNGTLLTDP